jgi:hypothetical protein
MMIRKILLLLLTILLGASWNILAEISYPDFNGSWRMNLDDPESTPMSNLLKALDRSRLVRKMADSVTTTQNITQTGEKMIIEIDGGIRKKTETLVLDGSVEVKELDTLGANAEVRSFWSEDGQTIINVAKFKTEDGKNATWTTKRYIADDGKKMKLDHVLEFEGEKSHKATRIFIKQD